MKFILVIKLFRNFCFKLNMKSLNNIILIFLVSILTINLSFSQEKSGGSNKYSKELIETLSSYQKELIEKERKYLNKHAPGVMSGDSRRGWPNSQACMQAGRQVGIL